MTLDLLPNSLTKSTAFPPVLLTVMKGGHREALFYQYNLTVAQYNFICSKDARSFCFQGEKDSKVT